MFKIIPSARFLSCFALIVSSLLTISACQEELSGELPGTPVTPSTKWTATTVNPATHPARQLLVSMKAADIVVTLPQTGGLCMGGNCSALVPDNAFVKLDGTPVTGNVTITLTPATKYADMIFNGLSTLTDNGWLETGGMIRIKATQGSDMLKLKTGKTIKVLFPAIYNPDFKGYAGKQTGEVANAITWNLNNNWVAGPDSGQGTNNQQIQVDSLDWINCDHVSGIASPTNTYVKLPAEFGNTNTSCYIVFTGRKMIAGLYGDAANQRFWQGSHYTVPIGEPVKLIAVSKQDNKIYYGSAQVTIAANMTTTINTMEEITQAELNTRLNAL